MNKNILKIAVNKISATFLLPFKPTARACFTLAETLTTLMIIGIVATLVMPNMIKGLQDKIYDSRAKNAFYKLSQATDQMKVAGLLNQRYNSTAEFVDDLQKYLKITKRCSSDNIVSCFGSSRAINNWGQEVKIADLKDSSGLGISKWEAETEAIVMADGTTALLTYNVTGCEPMHEGAQVLRTEGQISNTLNCLSIVLDTNAKSAPNKITRDVRALNNMLDRYKVANSNIYIDEPQYAPRTYTYEECMAIGKTPCCSGYEYCKGADYWLSAYLTCEEKGGHLPTEDNILKIAQSIYGSDFQINTSKTQTMTPNVTIQDQKLFDTINIGHIYGEKNSENTARVYKITKTYYSQTFTQRYMKYRFTCVYD